MRKSWGLLCVGTVIRRRRLSLKMLQREGAAQIGVDKTCIFNWEANISSPEIRYMPATIAFLGYNPLPPAKSLVGQLVWHRTTLGLTQEEAAHQISVGPSTLAKGEGGESEPTGVVQRRVQRSLGDEEAGDLEGRQVG